MIYKLNSISLILQNFLDGIDINSNIKYDEKYIKSIFNITIDNYRNINSEKFKIIKNVKKYDNSKICNKLDIIKYI